MRNAGGFTLTELLITMVVMSFLGLALARILINNSDFVSRQDAMMEAREVARSAMNLLSPELRLISDSGVYAAHRDSILARIPYAFGVACARVAGSTYGVLLPADSQAYAEVATHDRLVWRTTGGYWSGTPVTGITVSSTALTYCDLDSIRVLPGGQRIQFGGMSLSQTRPPGTLFYLYQDVTYRFNSSVELPGRRALWRRAGGAPNEEMVAPFDPSARFAFLLGPNMGVDTVTNCTSRAACNPIRGLELWLVGASQFIPRGTTNYQKFDLRPAVAFLNRSN